VSLLTLIEKGGLRKIATATPATLATQETKKGETVAEVATVAVASAHNGKLEAMLMKHDGISIAIDHATGSALLLFKPSDVDIVHDVANVFQAFEAGKLTSAQRMELLDSLDYYEGLLERNVRQRHFEHFAGVRECNP
jgi:hypothetical protein